MHEPPVHIGWVRSPDFLGPDNFMKNADHGPDWKNQYQISGPAYWSGPVGIFGSARATLVSDARIGLIFLI